MAKLLLAVLAVLGPAPGAAAGTKSPCSLDADLPTHATIEGTNCKSELPVEGFCFAKCKAGFENKKTGASAGMLSCRDNQGVPTLDVMQFGACARKVEQKKVEPGACVFDDTVLPSHATIVGSDCQASLSDSN